MRREFKVSLFIVIFGVVLAQISAKCNLTQFHAASVGKAQQVSVNPTLVYASVGNPVACGPILNEVEDLIENAIADLEGNGANEIENFAENALNSTENAIENAENAIQNAVENAMENALENLDNYLQNAFENLDENAIENEVDNIIDNVLPNYMDLFPVA